MNFSHNGQDIHITKGPWMVIVPSEKWKRFISVNGEVEFKQVCTHEGTYIWSGKNHIETYELHTGTLLDSTSWAVFAASTAPEPKVREWLDTLDDLKNQDWEYEELA